jgi:hypothetical protein
MISILTLAAASMAPAPAETPRVRPPEQQMASAPRAEAGQLDALMLRALEAARLEAEAARESRALGAEERGDFQTQFARILGHVRGCDAAASFIADRPEIMGSGIDRIIADALGRGDRRCAETLAPLMNARAADTRYVPAGQAGLRFRAGAYLDAAGVPEGAAIMRVADAELAGGDSMVIWQARFSAYGAYHGTARLPAYLDYLAARMVDDGWVPSSTRRGIFALFALHDRCDLIARVSGPDPAHCAEAQGLARTMYVDPPSATMIESARNMQALVGAADPRLDEQGLAEALAASPPWRRMANLVGFVAAARAALGPPPGAP